MNPIYEHNLLLLMLTICLFMLTFRSKFTFLVATHTLVFFSIKNKNTVWRAGLAVRVLAAALPQDWSSILSGSLGRLIPRTLENSQYHLGL